MVSLGNMIQRGDIESILCSYEQPQCLSNIHSLKSCMCCSCCCVQHASLAQIDEELELSLQIFLHNEEYLIYKTTSFLILGSCVVLVIFSSHALEILISICYKTSLTRTDAEIISEVKSLPPFCKEVQQKRKLSMVPCLIFLPLGVSSWQKKLMYSWPAALIHFSLKNQTLKSAHHISRRDRYIYIFSLSLCIIFCTLNTSTILYTSYIS